MKAFIYNMAGLLLLLALPGCTYGNQADTREEQSMSKRDYEVVKSDAEWREQLTAEQYQVTRQQGTERAFTGDYHDKKDEGAYHCVCCGAPLFSSAEKYDSGSGWPSFWAPADSTEIDEKVDKSLGMVRTEVLCSRCGAHLGHMFPDGPVDKGGQRYCVNSASLDFQAAGEAGEIGEIEEIEER